MPEFPKYDARRKAGFGGAIALWGARSVWALFLRLPSFVRVILYIWFFAVVLQRGCSVLSPPHRDPEHLSPAQARKLHEISENYRSGPDRADAAKLAATIARSFPLVTDEAQADSSALLAVPFTAPSGNAAAKNLADSSFAQVYGRVAISHRGRVALPNGPLSSEDVAGAVARGREQHAKYILYGEVESAPGVAILNVKVVSVADASVVWSGSYPVAGADPAKIATEVDSKIPDLDGD
jgi:TolB-like protein